MESFIRGPRVEYAPYFFAAKASPRLAAIQSGSEEIPIIGMRTQAGRLFNS